MENNLRQSISNAKKKKKGKKEEEDEEVMMTGPQQRRGGEEEEEEEEEWGWRVGVLGQLQLRDFYIFLMTSQGIC